MQLRRRVLGIGATIVLAISAQGCGPGEADIDVSLLGPSVERLPSDAVAAVMLSPLDVQFKKGSIADISRLVFLNRDMQPVGHLRALGMFRSQLVRVGDVLGFVDRENSLIVSKDGLQRRQMGPFGISAVGASARQSGQQAVIWTDGGIKSAQTGYESHLVRFRPNGTVESAQVEGRLVASGVCGSDHLAIMESVGSTPASRVVSVSDSGIRQGAPWAGGSSQSGREMPWACLNQQVRVYLTNSTYGNGVGGTGVRTIALGTLASDDGESHYFNNSTPAEYANLQNEWRSVVATGDAWWQEGGERRFVREDGAVAQLAADGLSVSEVFRAKARNETVMAADMVSPQSSGLTYSIVRNGDAEDQVLSIVSKHDGSAKRFANLEWLRKATLGQPFGISDVAALREIG